METTNADRARNALLGIINISETQIKSLLRLSETLHEGMLSRSISNKVIADRCAKTAKLIAEKL